MATFAVDTHSDDGTHLNAPCLLEVKNNLHAASQLFGKDMSSVTTWKKRFERAGFVNVKEEIFKVRNLCPGNV